MQAAIGIPMTVYGTGGQTRGFIHVSDTAKCLQAAVENPPAANGPVEIFNQVICLLYIFFLSQKRRVVFVEGEQTCIS